MTAVKICARCGEQKPLAEFHGDRTTKDGHRTLCRTCVATYGKAWRAANGERIAAKQRENRRSQRAAIGLAPGVANGLFGQKRVVVCVAGFADTNGNRVCIVHGRPIVPLESCGGEALS